MPSQRRLKAFGLLVVLAVLTLLYMSSSARQTRSSPFYTKTVAALDAKAAAAKQAAADAAANVNANVGQRLKDAERAAKAAADEKGAKFAGANNAAGDHDAMVQAAMAAKVAEKESADGERSVAGRKMMKGGETGDGGKVVVDEKGGSEDGVAKVGNTGDMPKAKPSSAKAEAETKEDHDVEIELNAILKKSPIIIFSKSYCPHSARAKTILLSTYTITPPPHVVELDQHPLGAGLQAALARSTGRRTVPNVLINGKSIGGGDDVAALHERAELVDTVRAMGGKRVVEARLAGAEGRKGAGAAQRRRRRMRR